MRIAVLLANNDHSPFSKRFPSDGDKVACQLSGIRSGLDCRVWPAIDNMFPSLDDADGFIITGSPASVHDALPWIRRLSADIPRIVAAGKPLVGLCFGHQLIAQALGGTVENSPCGWRFGAVETTFVADRIWMTPPRRDVRLFASHSEQVTRLPRGATLLGTAAGCPYASFAIGSTVMTTQYHPEFSRDFMRALALEYEGELPTDVLTRGTSEFDLATDGDVFFEWIANLMELGMQPDGADKPPGEQFPIPPDPIHIP